MWGALKRFVRESPKLSSLIWSIRALWGDSPARASERYYKPRTRHLIDAYLKGNRSLKLHIGAQSHILKGWLNVDIYTGGSSEVAYLNATQTFPFQDNSFDYIFSEHMIEHISLEEALFMLRECNRILKPGGKIRIATPGMDLVFKMSQEDNLVKEYFREVIRPFYLRRGLDPSFQKEYIINYWTFNFGHRFIYSSESLRDLLATAQFSIIGVFREGVSDDSNLAGIEGHSKYSYRFSQLETINIEARKPLP